MLVNLVDHQNTKLSAETKNQALNHHIFRVFTVLSFVDNHQYIYIAIAIKRLNQIG